MSEHFGYLQVFVRTAQGTLPVEGARVLIEGQVQRELFTDRSGKTARIPLPTFSAQNSMTSEGVNPFASYRVIVEKEGFYRQTTENVPIFAGINSLQPITLIGLAEYESNELIPEESTDTVPNNPQALDRS